jgi:hypothetical protein
VFAAISKVHATDSHAFVRGSAHIKRYMTVLLQNIQVVAGGRAEVDYRPALLPNAEDRLAFYLNGRQSGETRISIRGGQPVLPFMVLKPDTMVRSMWLQAVCLPTQVMACER